MSFTGLDMQLGSGAVAPMKAFSLISRNIVVALTIPVLTPPASAPEVSPTGLATESKLGSHRVQVRLVESVRQAQLYV